MWSEKYRFFHELFLDSMKEPEFTVCPIHIDQSYFDNNLYQTKGTHSWNGCSLKIDLLIERLKTATSSYILFTDIDIIAKCDIYKNLKIHIDNEDTMVFLQEGSDEGTKFNIGFILLKVCPEVIEFWNLVKTKMNETPGHDQTYANDLIKDYKSKWARFDNQNFTCSNIWKGQPFSIIQPLSSCLGKEFDFAEKIYFTNQVCNIQDYVKYIPQDIIPFIYKFQELINNYHKAKQTNH